MQDDVISSLPVGRVGRRAGPGERHAAWRVEAADRGDGSLQTYGQEFGNSIQYHYPGDDYKDLMAGVDEVVKRGYVDPTRLGVTGGSGGGLLTNWTITQTQRFKAAVAQRDIADWYGFWFTADFTQFQPTWFRKPPWEDPQDYAARSPITHVANVTTPLMLVSSPVQASHGIASNGFVISSAGWTSGCWERAM